MEIIIGLIVSWLYFVVWFFAVSKYLHMRKQRTIYKLPNLFRYSIILGLLPGLVLDVIWNATYGTFLFKELPKEWTFSERLSRHWDYKNLNWRYDKAAVWAAWLNHVDPGHID